MSAAVEVFSHIPFYATAHRQLSEVFGERIRLTEVSECFHCWKFLGNDFTEHDIKASNWEGESFMFLGQPLKHCDSLEELITFIFSLDLL